MAKFCDVQKFKNTYEHRVGAQFDNAIHEMEKDEFCVGAIPIPEGITELDMIIPYLMHKETDIPIQECKKAYDVAIDYLRSQGKVKG
jgi:hypothetical protein